MNKLIPIFLFSLLIVSTTPAFANKLLAVNDDNVMFQSATYIPDPFNNSYFTLEKFERHGQSHWYSFTGKAGQEIFIQTLVPDLPNSKNLSVCFDLIIGQDKTTPDLAKRDYHDEFTNTDWIITCELKMALPADGLYYIRAHDELYHYSIGDTGKFSLSVGTVDNLTLFDWFQVPFWLLDLHLFFENTMFVTVMLTLVVIIAVGILLAIKSRK